MILKALHKAGWLDIGAQERIERELINFRRCLSPGQLIDVPDEYRYFKNIDSAIRCKLLEVVNYDSSPGSLVVNGELEKILFDSSSSSSLNSSSSSSYIKGISYRARNFSIKVANGCYIELGIIENDYPVYSNGNYILKYGGEYFPRWYLEDIATLAIHYTANPGVDPNNSGDLYTPFLFWLGNGGKINLGCGEESSSSSQSSSSSESSVSSQSSLSSLSSSESSESSYSSESSSSQSARLPAEYQEVEYLQSSGTQYIDTGVIPNIYDTDISIDCMPLTTNNRMWGVSQWNGTTTLRYREYVTSVGVAYLGSSLSSLSHSVSNRAVIAFIGGKAYNDGVLKMTYSDVDVTFTSSILIFAEFDINTIQKGKSSVYSAKLWESSVLVRDFVPAVRKSDSVAGMYDLVTDVFYTNQGTGNFIVGPNVY